MPVENSKNITEQPILKLGSSTDSAYNSPMPVLVANRAVGCQTYESNKSTEKAETSNDSVQERANQKLQFYNQTIAAVQEFLKNEKARLAQKAQTENESIQCDILMTSKEMCDKSVQATINAKLNRVRSACVKYRNTKSSLLRVSQSQKKLAGNLFWPTKSRLSVAITTDTSKLVGNHKSFNI